MNILFSSERLPLRCLRDVNQKYYETFYCFPDHLLYIDHGNTKFSYINTTEMRKKKKHFEKLEDGMQG